MYDCSEAFTKRTEECLEQRCNSKREEVSRGALKLCQKGGGWGGGCSLSLSLSLCPSGWLRGYLALRVPYPNTSPLAWRPTTAILSIKNRLSILPFHAPILNPYQDRSLKTSNIKLGAYKYYSLLYHLVIAGMHLSSEEAQKYATTQSQRTDYSTSSYYMNQSVLYMAM